MGGTGLYLLFESASGYGLFETVNKGEGEIADMTDEVQSSVADFSKFSQIVKLKSFQPFTSAENALENCNNVTEGIVNDDLKNFLEMNLPKLKKGKKSKFKLGTSEPKIASALQSDMDVSCLTGSSVDEFVRGIRAHFDKFIKELGSGVIEQAQLGLAHSYSRAKVKFNVNRADNMIIQSICLLDQLDKDLNTFSMRVREWYSWHFPELVKIVSDNYMFARLCKTVRMRNTLTEEKLPAITAITMDGDLSKQILSASKSSMGVDLTEVDMLNIEAFADKVISLADYRNNLHAYLVKKMENCAPNLMALIGEQVGARLISHAGSLTNLAKYPASTVQILGAEKALFRALKTRGNTPKYGLIFHSSFIGRASTKNKGRISRYLANKCSIASRVDCFSEEMTNAYGEKLKEQVEERLTFYNTGEKPQKNIDAMTDVKKSLKAGDDDTDMADAQPASAKKAKKGKKGKKRARDDDDEEAAAAEAPAAEEPAKKKKKKKSEKADEVPAETPKKKKKKSKDVSEEAAPTPASTEKKKKKKKKNKD